MTATMVDEKNVQKSGETKTWKMKPRVAAILSQIAALRGVEKQEVLDAYIETFENDLLELLARRQAEIGKPRKRPG